MTTTDPTPLAEQIAREHYLTTRAKCACPDAVDAGRDMHAWVAHIATVTERAVRERIAEGIEAIRGNHPVRRAVLGEATRIARGATDD